MGDVHVVAGRLLERSHCHRSKGAVFVTDPGDAATVYSLPSATNSNTLIYVLKCNQYAWTERQNAASTWGMAMNGHNRYGVILFLFFLGFQDTAFGFDSTVQVGNVGKRIVSFVRQAHQDVGFEGTVLAAQKGKVIAAIAVGSTHNRNNDPLTVDTLFEIASCTKPFTAIAVMKLQEDGKLNLDDSIAKHLPDIPANCRAITIRHLLQHTSGIPGTNSKGSGTEFAAVLPTFLAGGPRTPPGERHEYWNQGYSLLSEVIARASGKSYTQYVRESILIPCKMESTRFNGQKAPHGILVATGKSARGASRAALEHPYGEYGFQYRGMGGLVTNLIDLWRWDRQLARGVLLGSDAFNEMTEPGDAGYALGWRVSSLESDSVVHRHTGSVRGFLTSIQRNPTDDGCLFVLSNNDSSGPFNIVKSSCENLLAGKEPVDYSSRISLEASQIAQLTGTYRDGQGRTLTVSREGKNAKVLINWHGPITHGYLAYGKDGGLLFGTMFRFEPSGFGDADKVTIKREGDKITEIVLTIVKINKSIHFQRVLD